MIKAFILTLLFCLSAAAADDLADAKVAFTNLITYQKMDDIRALDLFSKHCLITYAVNDGKTEKVAVVPAEAFLDGLKKEIAQKHGSTDEYEAVKFSSDGPKVTVTATIRNPDSDKRSPFFAVYGRDVDDGVMRIEKFKATIFVKEQKQ